MTDFESSLRNAWREIFFQCIFKESWFHYTQAVLKNVRSLGLWGEMNENADFKDWVSSIMVVPLLQSGKINDAFEILMTKVLGEMTNRFKEYLNGFSQKCPWKNCQSIGQKIEPTTLPKRSIES